MPELPDLHVFAKNLNKLILNKTIADVEIHNSLKINAPLESFKKSMVGFSIDHVDRIGKELFFKLSNRELFSAHLMLNGKMTICESEKAGGMRQRIMTVHFDDGQALVLSDRQAWLKLTLNPKITKTPDAMSDGFTYEYFSGRAKRNGQKNVKEFLISQSIVKGIGNAYADEILYKANISPKSVVGKIPEQRFRDLYDAISYVLLDAIENIERISPDIISGEERSFLKVHTRAKQSTDDGKRIIVEEVFKKITYYTEDQELFRW